MIVFIDGRSGAGKTTFAARLRTHLRATIVHLDDFYPGWSGLAAASQMVATDVLRAVDPGFWRWDWATHTRGLWQPLDLNAAPHLIIEGCGALSAAGREAALGHRLGRDHASGAVRVLSLYIDADPDFRRARALSRDPFFEPYWQMWADQEALHHTRMPAPDISIDGALLDDATADALIERIAQYAVTGEVGTGGKATDTYA